MERIPKVKYVKVTEGFKLGVDRFPNFHKTGSIAGMRKIYGLYAYLIKSGSWIYHVDFETYRRA